MKKTQITVKQPDEPVELEILADSIVAISQGIKKLRSTRLKDNTLYLLIQHAAPSIGKYNSRKPSITEIRAVFDGIESLQKAHLKPEAKKSGR